MVTVAISILNNCKKKKLDHNWEYSGSFSSAYETDCTSKTEQKQVCLSCGMFKFLPVAALINDAPIWAKVSSLLCGPYKML